MNLSFNYTNIYAMSPMTLFFFGYTTDIFRTWMHFVQVNLMFYDTVNLIYDIITTATIFPYTAKFSLTMVEIIKLNNWDVER